MIELVGMSIATFVLLLVGLYCLAVFAFMLLSAQAFTGSYLPKNERGALLLLAIVTVACFYGVYLLSPIGISVTFR